MSARRAFARVPGPVALFALLASCRPWGGYRLDDETTPTIDAVAAESAWANDAVADIDADIDAASAPDHRGDDANADTDADTDAGEVGADGFDAADALAADVHAADSMTEVRTPAYEQCPGLAIEREQTTTLAWSMTRPGLDVANSCSSRRRPGDYRDAVARFETTTTGNISLAFREYIDGLTAELRSDCETSSGTCRTLPIQRTIDFGVHPPGRYSIILGVPRTHEATSSIRASYSGPSLWTYDVEERTDFVWTDACTLPGSRRHAGAVVGGILLFPMQVYDIASDGSNAYARSNGWLSLRGDPSSGGTDLGTTGYADGTIALFSNRLTIIGEGFCIASTGSAPNRQMLIQWTAVIEGSSIPFVGQIVVHETAVGTPNTIELGYNQYAGHSSPGFAVGIRGSAANVIQLPRVSTRFAWRLTPRRADE